MIGLVFDFVAFLIIDIFGPSERKDRSPWMQAFLEFGCFLMIMALFGIVVIVVMLLV